MFDITVEIAPEISSPRGRRDLSMDVALGLLLVGTELIGSRIINSSPSRRTTTDLLEPILVLDSDN